MPLDPTLSQKVSTLAHNLKMAARDVSDLLQRYGASPNPDAAVRDFNAASHERWERSKRFTVIAVHEALLEAGLRYAADKPEAFAGLVQARERPSGRPTKG